MWSDFLYKICCSRQCATPAAMLNKRLKRTHYPQCFSFFFSSSSSLWFLPKVPATSVFIILHRLPLHVLVALCFGNRPTIYLSSFSVPLSHLYLIFNQLEKEKKIFSSNITHFNLTYKLQLSKWSWDSFRTNYISDWKELVQFLWINISHESSWRWAYIALKFWKCQHWSWFIIRNFNSNIM